MEFCLGRLNPRGHPDGEKVKGVEIKVAPLSTSLYCLTLPTRRVLRSSQLPEEACKSPLSRSSMSPVYRQRASCAVQ